MTDLTSQLLNILPASEQALFQQNQVPPVKQKSLERRVGLSELKSVLRADGAIAFKHNKNNDSLYAYYNTPQTAKQTLEKYKELPPGNLRVVRSGTTSIRIDNASTCSVVVGTASKTVLDFDSYVRTVKAEFKASHGDQAKVSFVFHVDNIDKTITATATSSRLRDTEFELSRRVLSTRVKGIEKNVAAGYQATAVFNYNTYLVETAPKAPAPKAVAATETNALLESLKVSMAPTAWLPFAGKFTPEVIEQFTRILEGERLPARPAISIYDDESAVGKTQGTAVALFYKDGKRVDIEAILTGLRLKDKSAAVYPTEVAKAVLHDTVVVDPSVIIMRDHGNENKAYLVLNTTKGFHRHIVLNKRK